MATTPKHIHRSQLKDGTLTNDFPSPSARDTREGPHGILPLSLDQAPQAETRERGLDHPHPGRLGSVRLPRILWAGPGVRRLSPQVSSWSRGTAEEEPGLPLWGRCWAETPGHPGQGHAPLRWWTGARGGLCHSELRFLWGR